MMAETVGNEPGEQMIKRYKTKRRSLRPWHYSLATRLLMRVKRPTRDFDRRYEGAQMRLCWHYSFRR
jgi:hypothetical protein